MDKAPDAFRTISEVADHLETPAHVLRFWESRFPQIRPVKRAGGRRYYRPADVALLTGIKRLLHDEGLTIRGVQKILREQGVRHVAGLSGDVLPDDIDQNAEAALEAAMVANFGGITPAAVAPEQAVTATIVALETALKRDVAAVPDVQPAAVDPWQTSPDAVLADLFAPETNGSSARPAPLRMITKSEMAAELRALPTGALDRRHSAARAVLDQLTALHNRLSSAPQFNNR